MQFLFFFFWHFCLYLLVSKEADKKNGSREGSYDMQQRSPGGLVPGTLQLHNVL